ncbi:hypothetical protein A6A08_08115 [Nocardiopsis sp. TSRI0078]|uniref:hypothetical protein n=1 Tax=unclassified Nocardiopsis TaxID=2649073 RepID=UPI000939D688|nr:hypothetical protein [Nocardiopsis sp. TSRI0078]OKI17203.1 hypothetical protein A6A08_08115 [Nocardiopsis sp. TSRI0078]
MQKKTLYRVTLTVIAAPVLAFGAPAVASADAYYESETSVAGHGGAFNHEVESFAGDGEAWFEESWDYAGKDGAYSSSTESGAD